MSATSFPPAHTLCSHQPPALLVAELLRIDGPGGRTRLLNPHGLDLLQLIEGAAQSVAVIRGQIDGRIAQGMLVALHDAHLQQAAAAGDAVQVQAQLLGHLPPLWHYQVQAFVGTLLIFQAELKIVSAS